MSLFGSDFQTNHKNLFNDVKALNTYTMSHKIELSNVTVKDVFISKAEFNGGVFQKVIFDNVSMEDSVFNDLTFKDCEFKNSNFNAGNFLNCEFVNCKISDTKINRAVFRNGKFQSCNIKKSGMVKWSGDAVEFSDSTLLDTPLAQGNLAFTFQDTDLDGVRIMMTEGMHPLLIHGGSLSEVDFGKSHFSTVSLRHVKQGEGPIRFNSITADTLVFDDVDLTRGVGIAYSKVKLVKIVNGRFGAAFEGAAIAKVVARDVYLVNIDFSEAVMPSVSMNHCELLDLALWDSTIIEFSIMDSSINIANGKNFKGDTVVWDSVTLDGKIDFSNAKIEDFRPTRLKRGPKLNLITTGSNLKF